MFSPPRGKMNKAFALEKILASGHTLDCFRGKHDFARKFLLAALCWLLAGLWHWLFFLYCILNSYKADQNNDI